MLRLYRAPLRAGPGARNKANLPGGQPEDNCYAERRLRRACADCAGVRNKANLKDGRRRPSQELTTQHDGSGVDEDVVQHREGGRREVTGETNRGAAACRHMCRCRQKKGRARPPNSRLRGAQRVGSNGPDTRHRKRVADKCAILVDRRCPCESWLDLFV